MIKGGENASVSAVDRASTPASKHLRNASNPRAPTAPDAIRARFRRRAGCSADRSRAAAAQRVDAAGSLRLERRHAEQPSRRSRASRVQPPRRADARIRSRETLDSAAAPFTIVSESFAHAHGAHRHRGICQPLAIVSMSGDVELRRRERGRGGRSRMTPPKMSRMPAVADLTHALEVALAAGAPVEPATG